MKKAQFTAKQDPVAITTIEGKTTIRICLNEEKTDVTDPMSGKKTGEEYVYDYNEWTEPEDNINKDAIEKAPERYLDYVPQAELTDGEKIEKALANSEYAIILAGGEL